MDSSIEKVKERIRKLLNLSRDDAAAQGEIANAVAFATKLMNDHHLSEDDIEDEEDVEDLIDDVDDEPVGQRRAHMNGKRMTTWEGILANFVCELVGGVKVYIDNNPCHQKNRMGFQTGKFSKTFVFYGIVWDCKAAVSFFDELSLTIVSLAQARYGSWARGDGASYGEGFVRGLSEALRSEREKERQQNGTGTSLMLVTQTRHQIVQKKRNIADDYIKDKGIKLGRAAARSCRRSFTFSSEAYYSGKADGRKSYSKPAGQSKRVGGSETLLGGK